MASNSLLICAFISLVQVVSAQDVVIANWIQGAVFPANTFVQDGQDIVLLSTPPHTAFLFENEAKFITCDFTNSVELATLQDEGGIPTLRFTANFGIQTGIDAVGESFFVGCQVPGHCANGQKIKFTFITNAPTNSPTFTPPTNAPTVSPTNSPTTSAPTQAPVVPLKYKLPWALPIELRKPINDATVLLGDKIDFDFVPGVHNLLQFENETDFLDCNFDNAVAIVGTELQFNELGTFFFACNVPLSGEETHCDDGMKLKVTVVDRGVTKAIPWFEPLNAEQRALFEAGVDANVEDILAFEFSAAIHNLFQFDDQAAFDACDFTRATAIDDDGEVTETRAIEAKSGDTVFFGCNLESHCANGQKLAVRIEVDVDEDENNNAALIAGAAVGGLAVLAVLGALYTRWSRRRSYDNKYGLDRMGEAPQELMPSSYGTPPQFQQNYQAKMSPKQNYNQNNYNQNNQSDYSPNNNQRQRYNPSAVSSRAALSGLNF